MKDHFFVALPSFTSAKYYPNKTVTRFVTKLPETIRLQWQYEMALTETIYLHNWCYVGENKDSCWIAAVNKDAKETIYLPPGYYADGTALIEVFGFASDVGAKFSLNSATGQFSLTFVRPVPTHSRRPTIYRVSWYPTIYPAAKSRSLRPESAIATLIADWISCAWTEMLRRIR